MPQIGFPQKNIQDPFGDGYPATTPAAAGRSSFILGQNLTEALAQRELSRPTSDLVPLPNPWRVEVLQPDLPKANVKTGTLTPSTATDSNGNRIIDSNLTFSDLTTGGAFDLNESARGRAIDANGRLENATVLAQPLTNGFGAGYGAMSGGTPKGEESGGYGNTFSTQASFSAINRTGSRNHANMHVIARPGASEPFLV